MGLSSSSNFGDVRRCVLWAAVKLNLPDNKIAAIKYAFDEVKIDDSTRKATLQGSVSDYSTSEFISGVDVTLLGTTVSNTSTVPYFIGKDITPRSGRYSFQLEAGKYTIFVAKEGYVTLSAFPSMTSKDVTMDVRLVRPGNGSLSGKAMKSGDKSPLQRVTVNVRSGWYTQNAPVFQTTSTGANGEYSFPSLNNGYYTVELRKSGYKIATFNVIVSGNTTGQVWNMEEGIDIENGIPINEEYFPDEYFRWYLNRNIDSDKDGILSKAELENTTRIDLGGHHYCTSLQGIKYFLTYSPCLKAGDSSIYNIACLNRSYYVSATS